MLTREYWAGCWAVVLVVVSCGHTSHDGAPGGPAGAPEAAGFPGSSPNKPGGTSPGAGARCAAGGAQGGNLEAGGAPTSAGTSGLAGEATEAASAGHGGAAEPGGNDGGVGNDGGAGGEMSFRDCGAEEDGDLCPMSLSGASDNVCLYDESICICVPTGPAWEDTSWKCYPRGCPATQPQGGCTTLHDDGSYLRCDYGETACLCGASLADIASWDCFTALSCPEEVPAEAAACTPVDDIRSHNTCSYGSELCRCRFYPGSSDPGNWTCREAD